MPYKSQAQRGKFHQLEREGIFPHKTVKEFDRASKGLTLPAHVRERKPAGRKKR